MNKWEVVPKWQSPTPTEPAATTDHSPDPQRVYTGLLQARRTGRLTLEQYDTLTAEAPPISWDTQSEQC